MTIHEEVLSSFKIAYSWEEVWADGKTHPRQETREIEHHTTLFCPLCGKQSTLYKFDEEYDAGNKYICLGCERNFYMSIFDEMISMWDKKQMEGLMTAIKQAWTL